MEAEYALQERDDGVDVQRECHTKQDAERHAQPADDQTLRHEDTHHAPGRGTECAKDGDVRALVRHDHH